MTNFINRMAAEIAPEMAEHCARWRAPSDWAAWSNNVQFLRHYAINRPESMRRHLTNQFRLRGWVNLTLQVNDTNAGAVRLNSITVNAPTNAPWSGIYFRDNPVAVTAQPQPGYQFLRWDGLLGPNATNPAITNLGLTANLALTAHFEALPATNAPFPPPFDLRTGPYLFTRWDASAPARTYPPHTVFLQTATNAPPDPGLTVEYTNHWLLPYHRTNRSRILGLGDDGLAFLNTSDPQSDGGGYLGAAVLALNTTGKTNLDVAWRGGTVAANSRAYAIRLQARVGPTNTFTDVLDAQGSPVEYVRNAFAGHSEVIGPVALPRALLNQPYVQLRWKYYWRAGGNGARDALRLDDIVIGDGLAAPRTTSVKRISSAELELRSAGTAGLAYSLQVSTNLVQWTSLGALTASTDGAVVAQVLVAPGAGARFYRLRWP
jgi:hypothetical protein